mgnify:CR=1 FL=1
MNKLLYLLTFSFYSFFLSAQEIVITDSDLLGDTVYNWTKDNTYLLDGLVFLERGGVLNIEAGTVIRGRQFPSEDDVSLLIITQGAQINAIGTAEEPIIFTTEDDEDLSSTNDVKHTDRGLWGGVMLMGEAPISAGPQNIASYPGLERPQRNRYGGAIPDDSSGSLVYVSIRHAGAGITLNIPNSGLTIAGVGSETVLHHIEVIASGDGGIEILGGAAQLKYIVSAINADNSFEYRQGWQGKGQFWFGFHRKKVGDIGGAFGGGNSNDPDNFTSAIISNATFLGSGCETNDPEDRLNTLGLQFRGNLGGTFTNNIISGFKKALEVQDFNGVLDSRQRVEEGILRISNNLWNEFCEGSEIGAGEDGIFYVEEDFEDTEALFLVEAFNQQNNSLTDDPGLKSICRKTQYCLNPLLRSSNPALHFGQPVDDPFFDPVTFIGAFDDSNNWMAGWTGLEHYKYLGSKQQGDGQVVIDQNGNCEIDPLEGGFEGFILSFQGAEDTLFTQTDAIGRYSISLDTGEYIVHLDQPNEYWSLCDNDFPLNIRDTGIIEYPNFVLQAAEECPFLTIDISTPFLRRCFDNTYKITYCNSGTILASNAEVQLTLDSLFTFVESSIPFSAEDGLLYTFPIGDLGVGECGQFSITINLSCDAFLGQSHCLEAVISPNTPCGPATPSARIDINGSCENGNIEFSVENVGELGMDAPSQLIVIEDDVMFLTQPFQLEQTAALPVMVIPEGKTIRIQTERIPGDPSKGIVSRTIEGCGTNGETDPPYSTGFVNQFPMDEYEDHVAVDCRANQGAFDPNDKRAFPAGYGTNYAITPETQLEYLIRFQNTGTDTAFTVLVHDTLSQHLDPTSIEIGASSHDFEWKLQDRLLSFHFADIMLPDSNTNEPASHGFVQFKIKPYVDSPLKTVIPNQASIYFDFNEPIITPAIFHTLDRNFIVVPNISSVDEVEMARFRLYPSPMNERAILELEEQNLRQGQFRLLNALGQVVIEDSFVGQQYQFHRKNLGPGQYFFQVFEKGKIFISGQLIIQ